MKPLRIIELEPIFTHERTELYRRARELHAFAAQLETDAGNTRYFGALTQAGLLAMLSVASAGVAPSDRARGRCLARLRAGLSRFASTLRSMADRGLLEENAVKFGAKLVAAAEALVSNFDIELKAAEAALIVRSRDAERHRIDSDRASDRSVDAAPAPGAAPVSRSQPLDERPMTKPANDEALATRSRAPSPTRSRGMSANERRKDHLRGP